MNKIKILLADDHQVVRMGLAAIIAAEGDMCLVGEACDGAEAVKLARELAPDIILMDLLMPQTDGAQATAEVIASNPAAKVLILTTFGESDEMTKAMDAGATGALIKDTPRGELVAAIRSVARGERVVSPEIAHVLAARQGKPPLSSRKREVLAYVAKGLTSKAIAAQMGITQDGVNGHLRAIFAHLNAASRTEAVAIAQNLAIL
jgi:DNA-binding NarL/FixJ family response regulator